MSQGRINTAIKSCKGTTKMKFYLFKVIHRKLYWFFISRKRYDKKLIKQIELDYYRELEIMERIYRDEKNKM
jgi:hypothetical protein